MPGPENQKRLSGTLRIDLIRGITWRVMTDQKLYLEHQALSMAGNGIAIT